MTVTYTDDGGIDPSSIDVRDLAVNGPGGRAPKVSAVDVDASADGTSVTATYTLATPGGSWGPEDNGTYRVALKGQQVVDAAGNPAGVASATFDVAVEVGAAEPPPEPGGPTPTPTPAGPTAPVATLSPTDHVTTAGGDAVTITVTYADDEAINAGTIDVADITVARDGGPTLATATVSAVPGADGKSVTATYVVRPPGGTWDAADNGTYTVTVNAGQVSAADGAAAETVAGTFRVEVPVPRPAIDPTFGRDPAGPPPAPDAPPPPPVNTGLAVDASVAQPDGRILVAGRRGEQYVVKRFTPDGQVDRSFGNGGEVVGPAGDAGGAHAIAVAADGGILVAGERNGDFVVTRLRSNGAVDARFGTRGVAEIDAGGADDAAYALAAGPGGTILVGGSSGGMFAVARLLADGRPDPSFGGGDGVATVAPGGGASVVSGLVVQPDGRVVAAGASGATVAVVRLNADGSLDTTFGSAGTAGVPALAARQDLGGPADFTVGVARQADGGILVGNQAGGDFAIARLDAAGRVDPAFGTGGLATVDVGGDDDVDALVVQATGEVVALGTTDAGGPPRIAAAALDAAGRPITAFGEGGVVTIDPGLATPGRALNIGSILLRAFGHLQPNGQVIVGGTDGSPAGGGTTNSGIRQLNPPGTGVLGRFGQGADDAKPRKLLFRDADGTLVTVTIKGGSGTAFYDGAQVDLVLTGTTAATSLVVKAAGGVTPFTLRNITSDGSVRMVNAKTVTLGGTLASGGDLGTVRLGSLTGTVAAAGDIGRLQVAGDMTGAKVFSGGRVTAPGVGAGPGGGGGGSTPAPRTLVPGSIGQVRVMGSATSSVIAAGLNPGNAVLLDGDDDVVGGAASTIGSVVVRRGVDRASRIVAGAVGVARVPAPVDPATDPRFEILP